MLVKYDVVWLINTVLKLNRDRKRINYEARVTHPYGYDFLKIHAKYFRSSSFFGIKTRMTRSDEAQWWFNAVYEAVQEIPRGRVTSYGHIARLLGKRTFNPRLFIPNPIYN